MLKQLFGVAAVVIYTFLLHQNFWPRIRVLREGSDVAKGCGGVALVWDFVLDGM